MIADVAKKSPAEEGGLLRGDIVLEYNGEEIKEVSDLTGKVALTAPGEVAKLTIIREDKTSELNISIGEFPEDEKIAKKKEEPKQKFGLSVTNITPQIASRFDLSSKEGVIVSSVSKASAASEAGFRRGDIIVEINKVAIKNVEDYGRRIDEIGKGNSALFLVKRGEITIYVGLKIE